ncbi:MAG: CRISPR-associated protein Cas5 [Thermoproteota archaeon]
MTKGPLLVFDLVGPMAHFRKFYTNSSSLSYPFPPRTTLAGIIAALLGWERDSYYEKLASHQARLGIALRTPVRSLMQTANYLYTKGDGWDGSQGHTQIPLEFILPHPPELLLRYRVYFTHVDEHLVYTLHKQLASGSYRYPVYLGITECPGWVENACLHKEAEWQTDPERALPIATVVPLPRIRELSLPQSSQELRILKDRIPLDFHPDRRLKDAADVLWEAEGRPLTIRVQGMVFRIAGEEAYGTFLEI